MKRRLLILTLLFFRASRGFAEDLPQSAPAWPPVLWSEESQPLPVARLAEPMSLGATLGASGASLPLGASSSSTLRERAEDLGGVILDPVSPSYSLLQNAVVAEGSGAFHLAHPTQADSSVTLVPQVQTTAGTRLFFESRLGYATSTQIARLQVSTNGSTWTTLWSRPGSGGVGQEAFELVDLSLAAYAGQAIRIRFLYDYTPGSRYPQTSTNVGWIIDDIQVGTTFIPRPYDGFGDPSALEIQSVEFINRARADAAAEAARLRASTDPDVRSAVNYFGVNFNLMDAQFAALPQVLPPLAINGKLLAAARLHSQDMLANNFQGHSSSANPPSPNQAGDDLGDRVTRQNYVYSTLAENVYAYADSVWHAHAGFNIDWGFGTGGMQDPAGHRLAIHNANYREIGVGIVEGSNGGAGPMLVTQDFGRAQSGNQPFLTGVTYRDANGNGFYDPGEGLGGVLVTVEGGRYGCVSSTHGAYALPLPGNGEYAVGFELEGYATVTRDFSVQNGWNAKADFLAVEQVNIDSVQQVGPQGPGLRVRFAGNPSRLGLEGTTAFTGWSPIAAVVDDLGGGDYLVRPAVATGDLSIYRLTLAP
jgi:uncharacterized protein YkwD